MSDLIPGLGAHVLVSGTPGFHKEELARNQYREAAFLHRSKDV